VVYKLHQANGILSGIVLFALLACLAGAETPSVEYRLKAELLERFTKYIEWPAESPATDPNAPFFIGIIGENPFGSYLERFSGTSIKGKTVQILAISNLADVDRCQVLFVSRSETKNLDRILSRTSGKPILTVGDTDGFARRGVLINFYHYDDYIRFQVNQSEVDRSGLKFSSRLLKLAQLVETEKE
jgi:hypothetical protein